MNTDVVGPSNELPQPQTADEILRCMGRNLLIGQQIEALLKALLEHSDVKIERIGDESEYQALYKSVERWTMGRLAGGLIEDSCSDLDPDEADDDFTGRQVARFRFRLGSPEASREDLRRQLSKLVAERNELVHHFLPSWTPRNQEGISSALKWLNAQREHMVGVCAVIKSILDNWTAARKVLAQFMAQPTFELLLSPLVHALIDFLQEHAEEAGWSSLARAGQYLHKHQKEAMNSLVTDYGYKKLRAFMEATGLFELAERDNPGGGAGLYVRLRR